MMQFSVAPWRVLDQTQLEAVKKSVEIRNKFKSYILDLAVKASQTGEPMMTSMEFNFPHQGYAQINDQFLLGDRLLVAPVLNRGAVIRKVIIPEGKWKSFQGETISGPRTIEVEVQLDDLPYYEKLK